MPVAALWDELVGEEGDPLGELLPGPFGDSPAGGLPLAGALAPAAYIVEVAFGADLTAAPQTWSWTDVTADVLIETAQVVITQGRADETSQAQPATCTFQLDNTSGAYSPYNPAARWWPSVRRNTPVRVRISPDGSMAGWHVRFQGYANGFPPSWNTVSREATVTVSASGLLRRLQQGRTPLRSALYRLISKAQPAPKAYWPCEDGTSAVQCVEINGRLPLLPTPTRFTPDDGANFYTINRPAIGAVAGPIGSANVVGYIAGGQLTGYVTPYTSTGKAAISFWIQHPLTANPSCNSLPLDVYFAGGTIGDIVVILQVSSGTYSLILSAYRRSDNHQYAALVSTPNLFDALWHEARIVAQPSGSDTLVTLYIDGVSVASTTATGETLGIVDHVVTNIGFNVAGPFLTGLGPISVWDDPASVPAAMVTAGGGYNGETATARLARLCGEEGIQIDIAGTSTTTMGPQSADTLLNLLRECEATDAGVLADGFGPGLRYITRTSRYNQPAAMTLDATADEVGYPFAPVDDDQRNRNQVKVDRKNGSSATYEDVSGPLGTKAIGTYDSSLTVNPADDSGLRNRAAWEVRRGTIQGLRYPTLIVDLLAAPQRIADWLATVTGSRVDVANVATLAPAHPPGTVPLIVEGWIETFDSFHWSAHATCSPNDPYVVAEMGTARVDSAGSSLAQDAAAGSTSLSVSVTGSLWGTSGGNFPQDFWVGGLRVTVTAVGVSTDAFSRTVASGWGNADTGEAWSLIGAGGSVQNSDWSVGSGVGTESVPVANGYRYAYLATTSWSDVDAAVTFTAPLATGAPLEPGNLLIRGTAAANIIVRAQVETSNAVTVLVFAASGAQLGSATIPGLTHAGAGTPLRLRTKTLGSLIFAKIWNPAGAEPGWHLIVTDPAVVVPGWVGVRSGVAAGNTNALPVVFALDNFQATGSPQTFTVTGVTKQLYAGDVVRLWQPAYPAL